MGKQKSSKPSSDPGRFRSLAEPLKKVKPSPNPPAPPPPVKRVETSSAFLMSPEARLWLAEEQPLPSEISIFGKPTKPQPSSSTRSAQKKTDTSSAKTAIPPNPSEPSQEAEQLRQEKESLRQENERLHREVVEKEQTATARAQEIALLKENLTAESQRFEQISQQHTTTLERCEALSRHSERYLPLASLLEQRGVPTSLFNEAMQHLLKSGESFLGLLRGDPHELGPLLKKRLRLSCGDPICEQELQEQESCPLKVADPSECECCQNTESRRFATRLGRLCLKKRIYRVVLVGGSPTTHAEIQQLQPLQRIRFTLVDGKQRRDLQQAANDMRGAELVIIWAPTMLQHKISDLYTEQQHLFNTKLVVAQTRGLASMLREVTQFLLNAPSTPD